MNETDRKITRIAIIGAGYAGLMTALRLSGKNRRQPVEVTLINASDQFVKRPLLHEAATSQPLPYIPLNQFLENTPIHFVQGLVTAIDPDRQVITTQTSTGIHHLSYDYLVYALGSHVDVDAVPGVRDFAYTLDASGMHGSIALRDRLNTLKNSKAQILVCGGGATGIEAAAEVKDLYPDAQVTLVTQGIVGDFKTPRIQKYMERSLRKMGITILEHTTITEVCSSEVITQAGQHLPFDACIWAGGFKALPLAQHSGLTVNERQQILVDPLLRSISHPTIYAVGDSAFPVHAVGAPFRMSVFVAIVTGAHAADNLNNLLHGQEQQPFGFSYYGQAIALGRHNAIGFFTYPDDMPIGPIYTGRIGWRMRAFFVWFLHFSLKLEKRFPGFYFWSGKRRGTPLMPATAAVKSAAPVYIVSETNPERI